MGHRKKNMKKAWNGMQNSALKQVIPSEISMASDNTKTNVGDSAKLQMEAELAKGKLPPSSSKGPSATDWSNKGHHKFDYMRAGYRSKEDYMNSNWRLGVNDPRWNAQKDRYYKLGEETR